MITYFDTSAIIPFLIDEPSTPLCERLWNDSSHVFCSRIVYAEARAALARAFRMRRIDSRQLRESVMDLDELLLEVEHIEIDHSHVRVAGDLAEDHALRGYDAVHLATALSVSEDDLVLVTGDSDLVTAATYLGLSVTDTQA